MIVNASGTESDSRPEIPYNNSSNDQSLNSSVVLGY